MSIDISGNIETISGKTSFKVGDSVSLVFRTLEEECEPPFTVRIKAPDGKIILERVLRDLPTGKPQSAPPVQFVLDLAGEYRVDIWQLYGKNRGLAKITAAAA